MARACRMRWESPLVMMTLAWWRSRSRMLAAVVCSGRNRPQDSKGQWLAMPGERRSQAAETRRNRSWVPVSPSGEKPTSSIYLAFEQVLTRFRGW